MNNSKIKNSQNKDHAKISKSTVSVAFFFFFFLFFGFRKTRNCTIYAMKPKPLISCAVTVQLICAFVFANANIRVSVAFCFLIIAFLSLEVVTIMTNEDLYHIWNFKASNIYSLHRAFLFLHSIHASSRVSVILSSINVILHAELQNK